MPRSDRSLDFRDLVSVIRQVHEHLAAHAGKAVNVSLTLRNWAIGGHIHHYELHGNDRAMYGHRLIDRLATELKRRHVASCDRQRLYAYLAFYRTYPQIGEVVQGSPTLKAASAIVRSLTGRFSQMGAREIVRPPTGQFVLPGNALLESLSYTHLELLTALDDPLKRTFYEIECIRGNWSVRQLKRQIATLYFERTGLSRDKDKLAAMVKSGAETAEPGLAIREPYVFEFLGLRGKDAAAESEVEAALIENLRDFLLELGHGFCLEAQQKCILIGKTYGFVDLVFYHRLLKSHVLVDLKIDEFRHEFIGQLNTYVSWYRKNMMTAGDNPPVGLLLCTRKDHTLVEYALAGMDNQLFVSKYQLELPSKSDLQRFLEETIREVGGE